MKGLFSQASPPPAFSFAAERVRLVNAGRSYVLVIEYSMVRGKGPLFGLPLHKNKNSVRMPPILRRYAALTRCAVIGRWIFDNNSSRMKEI